MSWLPTQSRALASCIWLINPFHFLPGDAAHQSQVSFDQVSIGG